MPGGHLGHARRAALRPHAGADYSARGQPLTAGDAGHYSASMEKEIAALELKVDQLIAQCERLRWENRSLRSRAAGLEDERRRLCERMDAARERLEALKERLPA